MTVKKVWMSPDTRKKSRYALRTLGGIGGIVVLMLALLAGGAFLPLAPGPSRQAVALVLCAGATALGVGLALKLGRRLLGDATLFFLTDDDRLCFLDGRVLTGTGGVLGYAADAWKTQKALRRLAQEPGLPSLAAEILKVEAIRENASYYAIRCQVRRPRRQAVRSTCFLVKGYEDEDLLLRQLERRQGWESSPEVAKNPSALLLAGSVLAFSSLVALCVLSHPALGRLPQAIYFPALAAAFAAFFLVVYCTIRLKRGG